MRHLETAHVPGQNHVMPHVRSHWSMLRIALKRRSLADSYGQVVHIVPGSCATEEMTTAIRRDLSAKDNVRQ
jgi:hypothetical protein